MCQFIYTYRNLKLFLVLSLFLSPTGAQEMQIFVHLVKSVLELTIFIFWPQIFHDDVRMTERALREH